MNNQSDNNFTYSESTPFDESEINNKFKDRSFITSLPNNIIKSLRNKPIIKNLPKPMTRSNKFNYVESKLDADEKKEYSMSDELQYDLTPKKSKVTKKEGQAKLVPKPISMPIAKPTMKPTEINYVNTELTDEEKKEFGMGNESIHESFEQKIRITNIENNLKRSNITRGRISSNESPKYKGNVLPKRSSVSNKKFKRTIDLSMVENNFKKPRFSKCSKKRSSSSKKDRESSNVTNTSSYKLAINKNPMIVGSKKEAKFLSPLNNNTHVTLGKNILLKNRGSHVLSADGSNLQLGSNGSIRINGNSNYIKGNTQINGKLKVNADIKIGKFTIKDKGTYLAILNDTNDVIQKINLKKGNDELKIGKYTMLEGKRGLSLYNDIGQEIHKIAYTRLHKFNYNDVSLRDTIRKNPGDFTKNEREGCINSKLGLVCGGNLKEWNRVELNKSRIYVKLDLRNSVLITHIIISRKLFDEDTNMPNIAKLRIFNKSLDGTLKELTMEYNFKTISDEYIIPINTIGRFIYITNPFIIKNIKVMTRKLYDDISAYPFEKKLILPYLGKSSLKSISPKLSSKSTRKSSSPIKKRFISFGRAQMILKENIIKDIKKRFRGLSNKELRMKALELSNDKKYINNLFSKTIFPLYKIQNLEDFSSYFTIENFDMPGLENSALEKFIDEKDARYNNKLNNNINEGILFSINLIKKRKSSSKRRSSKSSKKRSKRRSSRSSKRRALKKAKKSSKRKSSKSSKKSSKRRSSKSPKRRSMKKARKSSKRRSSKSPKKRSSKSPKKRSMKKARKSSKRRSSKSPKRRSSKSPKRRSSKSPKIRSMKKSKKSSKRRSSKSPKRKSSKSPKRKSSKSPKKRSMKKAKKSSKKRSSKSSKKNSKRRSSKSPKKSSKRRSSKSSKKSPKRGAMKKAKKSSKRSSKSPKRGSSKSSSKSSHKKYLIRKQKLLDDYEQKLIAFIGELSKEEINDLMSKYKKKLSTKRKLMKSAKKALKKAAKKSSKTSSKKSSKTSSKVSSKSSSKVSSKSSSK